MHTKRKRNRLALGHFLSTPTPFYSWPRVSFEIYTLFQTQPCMALITAPMRQGEAVSQFKASLGQIESSRLARATQITTNFLPYSLVSQFIFFSYDSLFGVVLGTLQTTILCYITVFSCRICSSASFPQVRRVVRLSTALLAVLTQPCGTCRILLLQVTLVTRWASVSLSPVSHNVKHLLPTFSH